MEFTCTSALQTPQRSAPGSAASRKDAVFVDRLNRRVGFSPFLVAGFDASATRNENSSLSRIDTRTSSLDLPFSNSPIKNSRYLRSRGWLRNLAPVFLTISVINSLFKIKNSSSDARNFSRISGKLLFSRQLLCKCRGRDKCARLEFAPSRIKIDNWVQSERPHLCSSDQTDCVADPLRERGSR